MLSNNQRQQAEREIVRATIEAAVKRDYMLIAVDYGDRVSTPTVDDVMREVFSVDESHIVLQSPGTTEGNPRQHWVYVVLGNEGWTVVSDYSVGLQQVIDDTEEIVSKWEKEDA